MPRSVQVTPGSMTDSDQRSMAVQMTNHNKEQAMTAAEQQISPVAWTADRDAEWRSALRHASLVADVEIADEDLDQAIGYFGRFLWNKTPAQFRQRFPAFFVVVLTQVGMREWAQNTFYEYVAARLNIDPAIAQQLTREFHE